MVKAAWDVAAAGSALTDGVAPGTIAAVTKDRALVIVHSYYRRDTRPRRHATALAAAGWKVDVLCARDPTETFVDDVDGVRLYRLPARRRRGSPLRYVFEYLSFAILAFAGASALEARHHYRAVYVVGIPNLLVFAAAFARLRRARILLDMRDPLPEFFAAKYGLPERSALVRALRIEERISARFADVVLAPHAACARRYERSVARNRIAVVMNAPDPRLFNPQDDLRDPSDRTMLYTGTVAARYGVDLALRALARLRGDIPNLALRIVGDGDLLPRLRAQAREEGVEDRVHFDGPVPLDKIPAIVRSSWIGVQPNRLDPLMEFNLSTKILEWARLGLPVLTSLTAPLSDVFTGNDLLICEPDDLEGLCARIVEAESDPVALRLRAERARAAAERFRFEDQIAAFLRAIEGTTAS